MRQKQFKEKAFFEGDIERCNRVHDRLLKKIPLARDERHKKQMLLGLYDYSQRLVFMSYTIGDPISEVKKYAEQLIDDIALYATETNSDLLEAQGLEWYINCLWYLSYCYFFGISKEKVQLIADHISLTGKDMLIDRLIAASIPGHPIAVGKLAFPEVYKSLIEALSFNQTTEERTEKIQAFLKSYYSLVQQYDVSWHDDHKESNPDFCYHSGYWIFELGALAADIGWDDTAYRDHEMYPKDLVDWKFAQRPDYLKSKI